MTKNGIYVFVLFLLLTPPFAFPHVYDCDNQHHAGYWGYATNEFNGGCVAWRKGECNAICINVEHMGFGECDWDPDKRITIALVSMMNKY
ncbi:hypothetical protein SUGI_0492000 [Cryptomeria japonica]|nr:hypothetical protein SUGI_0492000 [Cryptomeria japonica]